MLLKHLLRLFVLSSNAFSASAAPIGSSTFVNILQEKTHNKESSEGRMRAVKRKTNVNRDLSTSC